MGRAVYAASAIPRMTLRQSRVGCAERWLGVAALVDSLGCNHVHLH